MTLYHNTKMSVAKILCLPTNELNIESSSCTKTSKKYTVFFLNIKTD